MASSRLGLVVEGMKTDERGCLEVEVDDERVCKNDRTSVRCACPRHDLGILIDGDVSLTTSTALTVDKGT